MSAKIPQIQSDDRKFNQYQQQVAKALQLIFDCPLVYGTLLAGVELVHGSANNIPHTLGRKLQGWYLVRQRAIGNTVGGGFFPTPIAIGIQDNQDRNPTPEKTLILYTTANITVDIWVY